MEASQEKTPETPAAASPEVNALTAKAMAAAEEANGLRAKQLSDAQQQEDNIPSTPISSVAARGYDALQEAFANHNAKTARKAPYIPPPRTERQMSALQEELEAGAKRVAANAAQQAAAKPNKVDGNKEGFTTPVYRPNDVVPDPIINKPSGGSVGGTRGFSPDV